MRQQATKIPLVVFGATLLNRFSVLVYLRAALLIHLAMEMFFEDVVTHHYLEPLMSVEWIFGLVAAVLFTLVGWMRTRKTGKAAEIRDNERKDTCGG